MMFLVLSIWNSIGFERYLNNKEMVDHGKTVDDYSIIALKYNLVCNSTTQQIIQFGCAIKR